MYPEKTAEPSEMPFGLWTQMGRRNHVLDGGPAVLRDVAMATNFGMQFAISGFEGYNFGCMTASNMQFDSRGRFSESNYPMKTWPRSSVKGSLPWQPLFGFRCAITSVRLCDS